MHSHLYRSVSALLCSAAVSMMGCGNDPLVVDTGALVRVTTTSQVGVLLEEFTEASRDAIATDLLARPDEWWMARAKEQLRLTYVRLVYRKYYFDEAEWATKSSLPLPPEPQWKITLDAEGPKRATVDGHDLVTVGYSFEGVLVTDVASPGISEPKLDALGGTWDESFVFPVDPTLLLQRTGTACMSEDQFPPESLDAEDAYRFYDDTCEVEKLGEQSCHYTEPLPTESCVDAVKNKIGHVEALLHYERLAWDDALADEWRFGEITTEDAPDLKVLVEGEGLNDNRVIYKYIPENHCAVVEKCVGGSGWRRLLAFDSHDHNVGGKPLHIGPVDYFVDGLGGELIDHNVYELSACHNHYHFAYYGGFWFGDKTQMSVQKMGFCLESTERLSNNEFAPLHTSYECENQGVDSGWGDLYGASLTCNWVDVTDVDTSKGPVTDDLVFASNPHEFMCEGQLVKDEAGNQMWEATEFKSASGEVVDRPVCEQTPGAANNDVGQVSVTIPQVGGRLTTACASDQNLGPVRNCGFTLRTATPQSCTPGETVVLSCVGGSSEAPQAVRVCEASARLNAGVDCAFQDSLANLTLDSGLEAVSFVCPGPRDAVEKGGLYSVYSAPVWDKDASSAVTCASP